MRAVGVVGVALLAASGCVDVAPFGEDRAYALGDETGIRLIADNNGAPVSAMHFPTSAAVHFPDHYSVFLGEAEDFHETEILADESMGLRLDAESVNALTTSSWTAQPEENPVPAITLSGRGLAQVTVDWGLVRAAETIRGSSIFTMFPDGRLIRTDEFTTSFGGGSHDVAVVFGINQTIDFGSYFSPPPDIGAPSNPTTLVDGPGNPVGSDGVCLESASLLAPTLGLARLASDPVARAYLDYKDAVPSTLAARYQWDAVPSAPLKLVTMIYGIAAKNECEEDVGSSLAAQVRATSLEIEQASETRTVELNEQGVYPWDLVTGSDDIVIRPTSDTAEGFALALEGEQVDVSQIRVTGDLEPDKGPALAEKHAKLDVIYLWIPSTVAAGDTVTVHLR